MCVTHNMMCNYYTIYINLLYIYTAYGESPRDKKSPTERWPKNQAVLNIHSILVCFELMDDSRCGILLQDCALKRYQLCHENCQKKTDHTSPWPPAPSMRWSHSWSPFVTWCPKMWKKRSPGQLSFKSTKSWLSIGSMQPEQLLVPSGYD